MDSIYHGKNRQKKRALSKIGAQIEHGAEIKTKTAKDSI